MSTIKNKIDFAVVVSVKNANPNGDPLNGNRPRVNYDGYGEISDVCLKRKIRNRLMNEGYQIFVQSDDNKVDDYKSLRERLEGEIGKVTTATKEKDFIEKVCAKWIDVRAFGQVFAYKGGDAKGVSIGIRGPVSIHSAFSIEPISTSSIQITKSVNSEGDGGSKGSDTMGMKHRVDFGVYIFYGSINPQLATKTGFSDDDAQAIKNALVTLFNNDASSARPEGSMEVYKVIWWQHDCPNGQYSSAKVHRSVKVRPQSGISEVKSLDDIEVEVNKLEGLDPEIIDGY